MLKNSSTSYSLSQQLPLPLCEVHLEVAISTAEARSRYILKSMGQGQLSYQRETPLGTFEARRVGKQGREYLWAIFFYPKQ